MALSGMPTRAIGAELGVHSATISRWVHAAPDANIRAALTPPDRAALGWAFIEGALKARERLLERLADTEEPIREISYAMRTLAEVGMRIAGIPDPRHAPAQATYIGGQHVHAASSAPVAELDDAELERRIAAARAIVEPSHNVVNETE